MDINTLKRAKLIINNLIPEQYLDARYHWNLDFASNEVTISES